MATQPLPINPTTMTQFADELIAALVAADLFFDVSIFTCGSLIASNPVRKEDYRLIKRGQTTCFLKKEAVDVTTCVEYCNPNTLSIVYEGPLYAEINYRGGKILETFDAIASKYGLYYSIGTAVSLSFFPDPAK